AQALCPLPPLDGEGGAPSAPGGVSNTADVQSHSPRQGRGTPMSPPRKRGSMALAPPPSPPTPCPPRESRGPWPSPAPPSEPGAPRPPLDGEGGARSAPGGVSNTHGQRDPMSLPRKRGPMSLAPRPSPPPHVTPAKAGAHVPLLNHHTRLVPPSLPLMGRVA